MKRLWWVLLIVVIAGIVVFGGTTRDCFPIPSIDSASIALRTVQYGTMPLQTRGRGFISRVGADSRATIQVMQGLAGHLKTGQLGSIVITGIDGSLPARVMRIGKPAHDGQVEIELSFAQPLPVGVRGGDTVDALIDYGRIENTLYIERGNLNTENADAQPFRLDTGKTATRVNVHFGVIASELIEIKSGLHQGDKVIVSDMSRWTNVDRVRLE